MSQEADERAELEHAEWQEDLAIREAVAAERERCAAVLEEMLAPLAGSEQYEERVGTYFLTEALRRVRGEG